MSDYVQHDECHGGNRGNRGRGRYRGRRPYWPRGNRARGQFHQTQVAENTARRVGDEFDLASEDGTGDQGENQRGQGRQRPRGRGRGWIRGRGEGGTTSNIPPLFPDQYLFATWTDNTDAYSLASEDGTGDQSENQRGQAKQRRRGGSFSRGRGECITTSNIQPLFPTQESFTGWTDNTDAYSQTSEDVPNPSESQRGQGRRSRRPRGEGGGGRRGRRGRGEGNTMSGKQSSFAEESFVEHTYEYSSTEQRQSTSEHKTRSEYRPSSASSKAEQRNDVHVPDKSVRVDQNKILRYLIKFHDGSCLVSHLRENRTLFETLLTPDAVIQALKQCSNVKVLRNENNLDGSAVKAFFKSLRLCFQHRPPMPCANAKCHHLHLCRDFVMDCCFMKHCVCSHDVESAHNTAIMNNCGVQIFNSVQQLSLVRCANLMVCREHNGPGGCPNPDLCFKLHICNAYVMNKCLLLDDQCSEGHDHLLSERNKQVLQLHAMERLPKETIFKMLLVFRREPQHNAKYAGHCSEAIGVKSANIRRKSEVELEEDEAMMKVPYEAPVKSAPPVRPPAPRNPNMASFSDFVRLRNVDSFRVEDSKDICDTFEEHSCNQKENCTDRHKSRTPYLWRAKVNGQWISLDKENSAIENAFSYPDAEEYWAMESIPGVPLCLNFTNMTSDCGPIQRLSTPSYVEVRDKVDATRWLWYWHDGSQWMPYGQTGEPPHLDILEAKLQHDPQLICCFEFGSTLYELDFAKMEQKNLRTSYVRRVRRRPLHEGRVDRSMHRRFDDEYHCDFSKLPTDWVPMDTESKDGTELVPLHSKADAYQRVAAGFFKTMDKTSHYIIRIYKIQNLDLWHNYQTKKTSIDKHVGRETEVNVFHGTAEEETTRWICGVGFDQRMHGVNGTVYGKGAYFATTAKYSHGYTQPSSRKCRYMFYAKITIGQVAKGDGSLKRPPPIDKANPKKGLYDSCVNSVSDPSIYVIFDNSQTYPDYLIEYRDIRSDSSMDQSYLMQSQAQAYAQAFNGFTVVNAVPSQPTHAFSSSAQSASSSIPRPSNPTLSNPTPANPSSSYQLPPQSPRPHPTSSQNSSNRCLVM